MKRKKSAAKKKRSAAAKKRKKSGEEKKRTISGNPKRLKIRLEKPRYASAYRGFCLFRHEIQFFINRYANHIHQLIGGAFRTKLRPYATTFYRKPPDFHFDVTRQSLLADVFIMSSNTVTYKGELVNINCSESPDSPARFYLVSAPPHTHERRMEIYTYFELPEDEVAVHLMGQPNETRHLVMKNYEAVISPSWSLHCGCGSTNYTFIWAMGGKNQAFDDMDNLKASDLK